MLTPKTPRNPRSILQPLSPSAFEQATQHVFKLDPRANENKETMTQKKKRRKSKQNDVLVEAKRAFATVSKQSPKLSLNCMSISSQPNDREVTYRSGKHPAVVRRKAKWPTHDHRVDDEGFVVLSAKMNHERTSPRVNTPSTSRLKFKLDLPKIQCEDSNEVWSARTTLSDIPQILISNTTSPRDK